MGDTYKIHGVTDEVTTCDCCGKSNLARTVGLEALDGSRAGDVLFFGTTCAARALGNGMKSSLVVDKAKALQKARPVINAVISALPDGIDAAKDAGNAAAKELRINGCGVSVSGFLSWGQINVDWNGGREVIPVPA